MSAYQVLYRKYRPKSFDDVIGQPQVTVTLKNELMSGRINHAYLFTGTRGTGKTTCAKILSKAVNCLSPVDGDPCGSCDICRGVDSGDVFDIVEMDAASNRGINDIKELIDKVSFTPERCKYRVFIIDEVHMLTTEAFNALLKTLEEPPEHIIFILATTEVHKLPATILSRCQRFDFHRIKPEDIAGRIKSIASLESTDITDEAALLISVIADGAMRDALSLLDRCIGLSNSVDAEVVRRAAGLAQKDSLLDLVSSCVNKNSARALSVLNTLHSESKDMSRLCDELIGQFRSLMLIKTVRSPRELVVMSDSEYETSFDQAQRLSLADIVYAMDVLQRAFERMGRGNDNRTELEMALIKLSAPELDSSVEALLARVSALEKQLTVLSGEMAVRPEPKAAISAKNVVADPVAESPVDEAPDISKKTSPPPLPTSESNSGKTDPSPTDSTKSVTEAYSAIQPQPQPEPVRESNAPRKPVDMSEILDNAQPLLIWPDVVNNLKQYSRAIASSFEGTVAYISGDYLLIDSKSDLPFQLLKNSSQRDKLRSAVQEITGKRYILGPYKRDDSKDADSDADPLDSLLSGLDGSGIEIIEE